MDAPLFALLVLFPLPKATWRLLSRTGGSHANLAPSPHGARVLAKAATVLQRDVDSYALQVSPHLILLQPAFYHTHLKPVVAEWLVVWLAVQPSVVKDVGGGGGFTPAVRDVVLAYIQARHTSVDVSSIVATTFSPPSVQLFNLAYDRLATFLPHCLSKFNRVTYGVLREGDIARFTAASLRRDGHGSIPQSRRLLAVPFVGKDVLSPSSAFAHPEVVFGLTSLAFRFEGLPSCGT